MSVFCVVDWTTSWTPVSDVCVLCRRLNDIVNTCSTTSCSCASLRSCRTGSSTWSHLSSMCLSLHSSLERSLVSQSFSIPCRCSIPAVSASPLPPVGHIWDVMLVWRKGNIIKTVSVLQYCVLLQWCTKVRAVLTGRLTVSGFDIVWFSFLSSKRLCVFSLHGAI